MTILDPRPWSPASPHIGPDEEDLSLLAPTGDPDEDLGSAILVVHRVGAAACEVVARAPLPDEFRLIDALARARAALAEPAVDAVSKCIGAERPEVYADLLMRDVFNAGEAGALMVYRACVAKGVAPPLAAQRAGLVYGVGPNDLGKYLVIASEQRAHPVALADAADRAIAKWASALVRDEVEASEYVAKQTLAEYNQTVLGHEHPKDAEGRFAAVAGQRRPAIGVLDRPITVETPTRVAGQAPGVLARLRRNGGGGQAVPAELLEQQVTATQPAPRAQRAVRATRKVRETRQTRSPVSTDVSAKVSTAVTSKVTAQLGTRLAARLDAQTKLQTEFDVNPPEMDEEFKADQEYGNIWNIPLAWAMSAQQARALYEYIPGAGTEVNPKTTEMGNLLRPLSEPMRWEHSDHLNAMKRTADQAAGPTTPRFLRISQEDLEADGIPPSNVDAVRAWAQRNGLYDMLSVEADGSINPSAGGYIGLAPSADIGNEDWFLIRHPLGDLYDEEGAEPAEPMAAEFVIQDDRGRVRGNIEGGYASQPYYELDPSQRYRIHPPKQLWKQTGEHEGHWVYRYHLQPLDDETVSMRWVTKAAPVLERERIFWQTEPRDETGRWTSRGVLTRLRPEVEVTPVTTPAQVRAQRRQRATRAVRQPAQQAVQADVNTNVGVDLRPEMKAGFAAAVATHLASQTERKTDTGFPMALDDRPIHKLMTHKEWGKFLADHAPYSMSEDVRPIRLNNMGKSALLSVKDLDGDEVVEQLQHNVAREITEDHAGATREIRSLQRTIGPNDAQSWEELRQDMQSYMVSHPEVAQMELRQGRDFHHVRVFANAEPVHDQVLIYMPEDFDPDAPVSLHYLGKARRSEITYGRWVPGDISRMSDPTVAVYRAQQRIYRADQSPRDE